jgi:hypothetical protein
MGFHPVAVAQYNTQGTLTNHKEHITQINTLRSSKTPSRTCTQNDTNTEYTHTIHIHAFSGIRSHDPSVPASEDSFHALDREATVIGTG